MKNNEKAFIKLNLINKIDKGRINVYIKNVNTEQKYFPRKLN